jgi:hypothetical protein
MQYDKDIRQELLGLKAKPKRIQEERHQTTEKETNSKRAQTLNFVLENEDRRSRCQVVVPVGLMCS